MKPTCQSLERWRIATPLSARKDDCKHSRPACRRSRAASLHGCAPGPSMVSALASGLDRYASCVIDPVEEQVEVVLGDVLVHRLARSLPVRVVVDNEHASGRESRVEV